MIISLKYALDIQYMIFITGSITSARLTQTEFKYTLNWAYKGTEQIHKYITLILSMGFTLTNINHHIKFKKSFNIFHKVVIHTGIHGLTKTRT